MRVQDAVGIGIVDRLLQNGAEAGHGDEIDLVAGEGIDHLVGVGNPVEVGAVRAAGDDLHGHAPGFGDRSGPARAVDEHHRDREPGVEHGAQNGPAAAREHPDPPHVLKVAEAPQAGRAFEGPCNRSAAMVG